MADPAADVQHVSLELVVVTVTAVVDVQQETAKMVRVQVQKVVVVQHSVIDCY